MFVKQACNLLFAAAMCAALPSQAGVDLSGPVQRVHLDSAGNLWFAMDTTASGTYCKKGWFSLNMYVPKSSPEFPYYFAMLSTAVSKGKSVYVANISTFDGSGACDITKTGYGLVLLN